MGEGPSIAMSCGVGHSHSLDPALLCLWHRLAATALFRPLAWESPYAAGAAQRNRKKTKKKPPKKTPQSLNCANNFQLRHLK